MRFFQRTFLRVRLRIWALFFGLIPIAGFLLINLILAFLSGSSWLSRKVEQRLGVEAEVDSLTWSPWAGVVASDLRLLAPEESGQASALIEIKEVTVDPSWSSLWQGRKRWDRLEVSGVKGEISIEALAVLLERARAQNAQAEKLEVIPEPEPPIPPLAAVPKTQPKAPEGASVPPTVPAEPAVADAPKEEPSVEMVRDLFEGVVSIREVSVKLYSERHPDWGITVERIDAEIPIWGPQRFGEITVSGMVVASIKEAKEVVIPVLWRGDSWAVGHYQDKLFGLNIDFSAECLWGPGLPFGMEIILPVQQSDLTTIYPVSKPPISVDQITLSSRVSGSLIRPSNLKGQGSLAFRGLAVADPRDGDKLRFGRGSARWVFSARGVVCDDFRLVGDDEAVLGNGFFFPSGEGAATVRVVVDPNLAGSHERRLRDAGLRLSFDFQPLFTPDRLFRDIRVEARDFRLQADLGPERAMVPLAPAVQAILFSKNHVIQKPR